MGYLNNIHMFHFYLDHYCLAKTTLTDFPSHRFHTYPHIKTLKLHSLNPTILFYYLLKIFLLKNK